jgi:hypothetical protein
MHVRACFDLLPCFLNSSGIYMHICKTASSRSGSEPEPAGQPSAEVGLLV